MRDLPSGSSLSGRRSVTDLASSSRPMPTNQMRPSVIRENPGHRPQAKIDEEPSDSSRPISRLSQVAPQESTDSDASLIIVNGRHIFPKIIAKISMLFTNSEP